VRADVAIIGIDLTGSEARDSGWCALRGDVAAVRRLAADEAIVRTTLWAQPDLVSLDAPLSLPRGRTRTDDGDPGRVQYGIMRRCERALRSRGIPVYPCLLPSMQKLTERGMRLAAVFRAEGIDVIECYPGGAQDVLGIPRKRAGLEPLRAGLIELGLQGSWTQAKVTHDELDAITAALVGRYYASGAFEAFGDAEEGLIILPKRAIRLDG
jgi:predicted nuclease with RNAse H fold